MPNSESQLFKSESQPITTPVFEIAPPTAVESITRAEVDMQISTAKRYPRDYSVVKRKMLSLATLDVETAESCFYKLSRQGKSIEGPSVRLAEIAASCFGNMRAAAQVVDNDGKTITARGVCHDLETNTCFAMEVKRRITGKDGRTYSEDMQVVTGNAACSIALRNAIFRTVPFALIKPVYEQARQAAVGDIKTLVERRTRMLKAFAAMGVNEARVLAALGKQGVEDIGLSELESLIGIHTAIKDGEQSVDDAFPAVAERPVFGKTLPAPAVEPTAQTQAAATGKRSKPVEATKPKSTPAVEPEPQVEPAPASDEPPFDVDASSPTSADLARPGEIEEQAEETEEDTPLSIVRNNLAADRIEEEELVAWAKAKGMLAKSMTSLLEMTVPRLTTVAANWEKISKEIIGEKQKGAAK